MKPEGKIHTTEDHTTEDIIKQLAMLEKKLQMECTKCDGTGKPLTKLGKPPESGHGDAKCGECGGTGATGFRVDKLEENITKIKKDLRKINDNLIAHMNRQTAEIRVIEEDGRWGDYSGIFYVDSEDEKDVVLSKAKKHIQTYFQNSVYHRNKKLGVWLHSGRSGKRLVENIETD